MTAEHAEKRTGLWTRFRTLTKETGELNKDIEFLTEDYVSMSRIAANLSSHTKWIPYSFLQNRIRKLADEVRTQSEALRSKISELGGRVPQVPVENREILEFKQNIKRLVRDMEDHANQSEVFVHHKNKIRDESIVKLIDMIIKQMQLQKNELMDIVMRLS